MRSATDLPSWVLVATAVLSWLCAEAAGMVANRAKPMDNTDMDLYWRKEVADDFAGYALRELRGDDLRAVRLRIARQTLE